MPCLTFPTLLIAHSCFASALAIKLVTDTDATDGSIPLTVAGVTAHGVRGPEVPEQRFASVADPSGDSVLALAELALRNTGAATHGKEVLSDTIRVTVTLLALWVIKPENKTFKNCFSLLLILLGLPLRGAGAALVPDEVRSAVTDAGVTAGHPGGANTVTVTSYEVSELRL